MKNRILVMVFTMQSMLLFGQDNSNFNLLETDSTWNQEIFHFPIPFAPEIKFEGFEDARFPAFWAYTDSSDFWSYVFVWSISNPMELTTGALESNIEMYFNGLMNYQSSVALFFKKETSDNVTRYVGKLKTFDALVTKMSMTLNVTAEYFNCEKNEKTCIVFRLSPQEFRDDIWNKLEKVKLRMDFCDI